MQGVPNNTSIFDDIEDEDKKVGEELSEDKSWTLAKDTILEEHTMK